MKLRQFENPPSERDIRADLGEPMSTEDKKWLTIDQELREFFRIRISLSDDTHALENRASLVSRDMRNVESVTIFRTFPVECSRRVVLSVQDWLGRGG
jgi:hypothetical protein